MSKWKGVTVWLLADLFKFANTCSTRLPDGRWVPARPLGWDNIPMRCRAAWLVFTGRADVVIWPGDEP